MLRISMTLALVLSLAGCANGTGACANTTAATAATEFPLSEEITAPNSLTVTSADFASGAELANAQVFSGFGCTGENKSPALSWAGAPESTKSYAIVAHDPDAPTGVGFFHWLAYDIPAATTSLANGAATALPAGVLSGHTDFGSTTYGGPCPPPGPSHRYIFTVYALDVPSLGIPEGASGALLRFMLRQHTVAYGRIVGTYHRAQ